eukprot:360008-Chlamydomonas_euryale.AAC.3
MLVDDPAAVKQAKTNGDAMDDCEGTRKAGRWEGHGIWEVMAFGRSWHWEGHGIWEVMAFGRSWHLGGHGIGTVMAFGRSWHLGGHGIWEVCGAFGMLVSNGNAA